MSWASENPSTHYRLGQQLDKIVGELNRRNILVFAFTWRNPFPRVTNDTRIGEKAAANRSKIVEEEILDELARLSHLVTEDSDRMRMAGVKLFHCAPWRVGEPTRSKYAINAWWLASPRALLLMLDTLSPDYLQTGWRRVRLKGGNEERAELKQEIRMLRDGRRHLEKLIAGHLTLPGQRGDTEVPWDDILDEDEIDEFTGQPGPEVDHGFEGISGRRYHEERLHNDGDPPIRFDENDPASYA